MALPKPENRIWRDVNFYCRPDVMSEILDEDCYNIDEFPDESSVVDIGACDGVFSLASLAKRCHVLAIEAELNSFLRLCRNVHVNRDIPGHIEPVYGFATGDHDGSLREFIWAEDEGHLAPSVKIDERLWQYLPSMTRVIKCDVEGEEKNIFNDNARGFFGQAQFVLLEWHCYDGVRYKKYLEDLGFRVELSGCGSPYDGSIMRGMLYGRK